MLKRRESRSRCSLVWKKTGCYVSSQKFQPARRAAFTAPVLQLQVCSELVVTRFHDRKISLMTCFSSRAIASNSFVSLALRRVNARNTAHLISVTSAFSTAFTSVTWMRAVWLCDSAAVSSLPKGVINVAFSSIS